MKDFKKIPLIRCSTNEKKHFPFKLGLSMLIILLFGINIGLTYGNPNKFNGNNTKTPIVHPENVMNNKLAQNESFDKWRGNVHYDPCTPSDTIPERFDWREHNGCTPVKNQIVNGIFCGSCWAFAIMGAMESAILIADGDTVDLSEQWLVSCTDAGDCGGWNGWYGAAFNYLLQDGEPDYCGESGAVMEESFPYEGLNVPCGCPYPHPYHIDSWSFIGNEGEIPSVEQIKQAILDHGPITCRVVWNDAFYHYTGGIFDGCENGYCNHSVVLVGWDDNQGENGVWFLRNALGPDWGEDGYMRIEYGCSNVGLDACYVEYSPRTGLVVSPFNNFESEGPMGGPFDPNEMVYRIKNINETGIAYSITNSQSWVSISDPNGYLEGGDSLDVIISINSNANSMGNGNYADTINFINETDHQGDTQRAVNLRIGVGVIYEWSMDTDPGWTTEGDWGYGQPVGQGGEHGFPDPTSGYTGQNVYGYNLNGDYDNNLPEMFLTSQPIDCSELSNTELRFWRWLGVEQPLYDHARIEVSNDNLNWTTIWENNSTITDSEWQKFDYDISEVADGQPTVFLRWTMGPTDNSWRFCGWNIDDVQIVAIDNSQLLSFTYPYGLPEYINPEGGTTFRVIVNGVSGDPAPGTGVLHYDDGSGYVEIPMSVVAPNVYDAIFPAFDCGDEIHYYITAETEDGIIVTDPYSAPLNSYSAISATGFVVLYEDDFSTNEGWTGLGGDAEWTIGPATGGSGNDQYGGPDPAEDHSPSSDNYVLGNDLTPDSGGDYSPNIDTTYWITSPVIDCSDYINVNIKFFRWLGVEQNIYDHAYIQGYNGSSWVDLFENGSTTIDENEWNQISFDVSSIANGNPDFQIRFGLGPTDGSWQYCGWNIDDLSITAYSCAPDTTNLTIKMIPDNPPVEVPQGGSFTFTGILINSDDTPKTVDVWINLDVPDYGPYGPIHKYGGITINPNDTLNYEDITQDIPGNAPLGLYKYLAYCGNYPSIIIDSAWFEFNVIPGTGGKAEDWNLSGWFNESAEVPLETNLFDNYPNPFNSSTTFNYSLSQNANVVLEIYNLLGRKIATLVDGYQQAGYKTVRWNAKGLASGVYFYRLKTDEKIITKRAMLLK